MGVGHCRLGCGEHAARVGIEPVGSGRARLVARPLPVLQPVPVRGRRAPPPQRWQHRRSQPGAGPSRRRRCTHRQRRAVGCRTIDDRRGRPAEDRPARPASRNAFFQLWVVCSATPLRRPASAADSSARSTARSTRRFSSGVFVDGLAIAAPVSQTRTLGPEQQTMTRDSSCGGTLAATMRVPSDDFGCFGGFALPTVAT